MEQDGDGWCEAYAGDRQAIRNPDLAVEKHLIRDQDVRLVCGPDNRRLHCLSRSTGATIAIISSAFSRKYQLKVLAFFGTPEQVQLAFQDVSIWFMFKYGTPEPRAFIPMQLKVSQMHLKDSEVRFLLETKQSELLEFQQVTNTSLQAIASKISGEESLMVGFFIYGPTFADIRDAHKKIVSMLDKNLDEKAERIDDDASYSDDMECETTKLPVKHGNSDSDDMELETQLPGNSEEAETETKPSKKRMIMDSYSEAENNETQLSKKRGIMGPYSGAENETQVYDDSQGMEMRINLLQGVQNPP